MLGESELIKDGVGVRCNPICVMLVKRILMHLPTT